MSHALYSTRLYWAGTRCGVAKLHGVLVQLTAPPDLPGLRVTAIDYVPEVGMRTVMPYAGAWRDMTAEEARAADALLVRLTAPGEIGPASLQK
jgi:hypothetical protein